MSFNVNDLVVLLVHIGREEGLEYTLIRDEFAYIRIGILLEYI